MVNSANVDELEALRLAFYEELRTDIRAAAETAYALAFMYRDADVGGARRFDMAKLWANRALELLDTVPQNSLDQVASARTSVGCVPLPTLLHSGVVRERLADVLI